MSTRPRSDGSWFSEEQQPVLAEETVAFGVVDVEEQLRPLLHELDDRVGRVVGLVRRAAVDHDQDVVDELREGLVHVLVALLVRQLGRQHAGGVDVHAQILAGIPKPVGGQAHKQGNHRPAEAAGGRDPAPDEPGDGLLRPLDSRQVEFAQAVQSAIPS
jgi:hypothetical protein